RVDPLPGGLDLVAAHEQGLVAAYDIHDQTFIGIRIALLERLGETHVERQMAQAHSARPRILYHDPLPDPFVRLKTDDELVGEDRAGAVVEDRMGNRLELDDDLG